MTTLVPRLLHYYVTRHDAWWAAVMVNASQFLDTVTSIIFLYINSKRDGACQHAAISVIVIGAAGLGFALGGCIIGHSAGKPFLAVVAVSSAATNFITVVTGIIVAAEGPKFHGCSSSTWQGPIVWPLLATSGLACLCIDD